MRFFRRKSALQPCWSVFYRGAARAKGKMADKTRKDDASQEGISTRGSVIEGVVISDKMQKTVTVRAEYIVKVPKYQRMKRRHTKIKARNPPEINAKAGETVKIAECRPLSKTVHFVVIGKKESKK